MKIQSKYVYVIFLCFVLCSCKNEHSSQYVATKDTSLLTEAQALDLILNQKTEPESVQNDNQFTFKSPSHWIEESASGFRVASYKIKSDSYVVDVSVTKFPGDVGGDLANVNRWRNQINLPAITQVQLNNDFEFIPVGNLTIKSILYKHNNKAILAAIIFRNNESWFVKLMGDESLVLSEKKAYKQFLESFVIL